MKLDFRLDKLSSDTALLKIMGLFEGLEAMNSRGALIEVTRQCGVPSLCLDLAEIDYIDSAAISVILEMAKAATANHTHISIINANENIKKVLTVTKVDKILTILGA